MLWKRMHPHNEKVHVNPVLAIHHEGILQWLHLQEIPLSVHRCTAFKNLSVCVGGDS